MKIVSWLVNTDTIKQPHNALVKEQNENACRGCNATNKESHQISKE